MFRISVLLCFMLMWTPISMATPWWEVVAAKGKPHARHEASFVVVNNDAYLIGGRRLQPVDKLDLATLIWKSLPPPPLELHHFQAVSIDESIYFVGGFTGGWPDEKPVPRVIVYDTTTTEFQTSHAIPTNRQRGASSTVVYEDKIYVVGGIVNGHIDGHVAWFDEYDPESGNWRRLGDAPHARDHAVSVVVGDKLFVIGGRLSSTLPGKGFSETVAAIDVYNFTTQQWRTLDQTLPNPRAGLMASAIGQYIYIGGGESQSQVKAHKEVNILDSENMRWLPTVNMIEGRHGTHFAVFNETILVASGCLHRGGEPETSTIEQMRLPVLTQTQ